MHAHRVIDLGRMSNEERPDLFGALLTVLNHPEAFEMCEADGELFIRPSLPSRREPQPARGLSDPLQPRLRPSAR